MKTVILFIRSWCLSRTDTTKQGTVYFAKIHIQTGHKTRLLLIFGGKKLFSLEKIFPLKINYFGLKFNSGPVRFKTFKPVQTNFLQKEYVWPKLAQAHDPRARPGSAGRTAAARVCVCVCARAWEHMVNLHEPRSSPFHKSG